jgi:hypothetical protein
MPLAVTTVPAYPDVPQASGVPNVLRSPAQAPLFAAVLLIADAVQILNAFLGPQWGIFTEGGAPVAVPDSVVSVDFRHEARISNYPVEAGGFQSYDKVQQPYDARVRLSIGSSAIARAAFLDAIEGAYRSLDLFTVLTPEAIYPSANIIHYDYRREAKAGANLLMVDVWLEEVRVTATAAFSSTQQPQGMDAVNNGTVQPQAVGSGGVSGAVGGGNPLGGNALAGHAAAPAVAVPEAAGPMLT